MVLIERQANEHNFTDFQAHSVGNEIYGCSTKCTGRSTGKQHHARQMKWITNTSRAVLAWIIEQRATHCLAILRRRAIELLCQIPLTPVAGSIVEMPATPAERLDSTTLYLYLGRVAKRRYKRLRNKSEVPHRKRPIVLSDLAGTMIFMEHSDGRDRNRIDDVVAALRAAWIAAPQLRFGQLVNEAAAIGGLHMLGSEDDAWQQTFDTQAQKHRELLEQQARDATGMSPDERNMVASLLFGVHSMPPPRLQPSVTLVSWQVLETKTGARHLLGRSVQDREGRVSTRIAGWDPATRTAVTQSGRIYILEGMPGQDDDASYVFGMWAPANGIDVQACVNVTAEYSPAAITPKTAVQVPCDTLHQSSVHVSVSTEADVRSGDWLLLYCEEQLKPVGAVVVAATENDRVWVVNPRRRHNVGFTGDVFWEWWNERIIGTGLLDRLGRGDPTALEDMFLLSGVIAKVEKTSKAQTSDNDN